MDLGGESLCASSDFVPRSRNLYRSGRFDRRVNTRNVRRFREAYNASRVQSSKCSREKTRGNPFVNRSYIFQLRHLSHYLACARKREGDILLDIFFLFMYGGLFSRGSRVRSPLPSSQVEQMCIGPRFVSRISKSRSRQSTFLTGTIPELLNALVIGDSAIAIRARYDAPLSPISSGKSGISIYEITSRNTRASERLSKPSYIRDDDILLVCALCNVERGCQERVPEREHVGDVLCHVVLTVEWISSCGRDRERRWSSSERRRGRSQHTR